MQISLQLQAQLLNMSETFKARKHDYENVPGKVWYPLGMGHVEDYLSTLTEAVLRLSAVEED